MVMSLVLSYVTSKKKPLLALNLLKSLLFMIGSVRVVIDRMSAVLARYCIINVLRNSSEQVRAGKCCRMPAVLISFNAFGTLLIRLSAYIFNYACVELIIVE